MFILEGKMGKLRSNFILCILLLLSSMELVAQEKTPHGAKILGVQVSGKGCEQTTASVALSENLLDLSILFDNYFVEIGQGSQNPNAASLQKDCYVQLQVQIPQGWQMAFRSVDYRGFVAVPASAWAFHRFSILAQGQPIASLREAIVKGPNNTNYTVHVEQRPDRYTFTKCNQAVQTVNLLSQLGVAYYPKLKDRSIAQIALDSNDLSLAQNFSVVWKPCQIMNLPSGPGRQGPITPSPRPPRF